MAISRRALLLGGIPLALAGAGAVLNQKLNPRTALHYDFPDGAGAALPATPDCKDLDPTEAVTEGPFYTPNTPERRLLREQNTAGTPLMVHGRVLTRDCRPVSGAVLDVWSCDGNGVYDNESFRLRGHQFTDASGAFSFETVKPRDYRDFGIRRTPHIHVKVQGSGTRLLTTQLFFPGERLNEQDLFFKPELVVRMARQASGALVAQFDFVV
jgi:protocatechuate 3,4-dioxygenase beta subunit